MVFFFFGSSFVAAQDYEVIAWSEKQKLSWSDFKAEPTDSRAAAITASGISYRYTTEILGDIVEIDFTITAHFYPNKSWYRPELTDVEILGHEQLHFDISEIFARKMRKRMLATQFSSDVRTEVKIIYSKINEEMEAFQNAYDKDTNFSRDKEQQEIWKEKIKGLLAVN